MILNIYVNRNHEFQILFVLKQIQNESNNFIDLLRYFHENSNTVARYNSFHEFERLTSAENNISFDALSDEIFLSTLVMNGKVVSSIPLKMASSITKYISLQKHVMIIQHDRITRGIFFLH